MSDASAGSKFYQKQYPKRNQGIPRNIKEDRSLIEMSVDISAKISTNTGGTYRRDKRFRK